ncbi:MAG TPA: hypothetical protein VFK36_00960 [Gemmatimonadales bacterium]|nr:hypothetical protein [Gemmatimonadales bacterium]
MSRLAVQQHHFSYRGRAFHFVAYEAIPANAAQGREATPPSWYLMSAGKRWEVMPEVSAQPAEERDLQFACWLDQHVFGVS